MILPVMSFVGRDAALAEQALKASHSLDGKIDAPVLLVTEEDVAADAVIEAARQAFKTVHALRLQAYRGPQEWPAPQNYAWQKTARYIASQPGLAEEGWLWWESDACPLRAGWLAALSAAHTEGKKPFSGHPRSDVITPFSLNGVAIYPRRIVPYLQNTAALYSRRVPFDRLAGLAIREHGWTDISHLLLYNRKATGGSAGRRYTLDTLASLLGAHPAGVFLHGCDESVALLLQGKEPPPIDRPAAGEPPSFAQQTPWPCGLFTFPIGATPTFNFNATIALFGARPHLLTRRHVFDSPTRHGANRSDLAIYEIREPSMTLGRPCYPRLPKSTTLETWEDPRACAASDGRTYLSFATWTHHRRHPVRQTFTRLSHDWTEVERLAEPQYGHNHPQALKATGSEKNWTFFEHEGAWHFVYTIEPHVVARLGTKSSIDDEWTTKLNFEWPGGLPRGGTPPVRVGDEYFSFFHGYLPWRPKKRRYTMGAYAFRATPPFEVTRFSRAPILQGSEHDLRDFDSPLCIFPNGALLRNGEWLVTFGMNDEHTGWIRIPHEALLETMNR